MKKVTLSALAAVAVVGTAFAGPTTVVTSKEYKQPCVTPCFRDQEFQLDLFYSFNDASHQGNQNATTDFFSGPFSTPVTPGFLPGTTTFLDRTDVIPAGSTVLRNRTTSGSIPQYFNDGSGGGVGLNYFFARYFGIGVEGNWWDGCRGGFDGQVVTQDLVALPPGTDLTALTLAARDTNTSVTIVNASTVLLKNSERFGRSHRSAANQVSGSLILRYPFEGPICWAPYIFGGGGGIFDGKSTGFGHVGIGVEFRVTPNMGFFTDWRWEFMSGSGDDNGFNNNARIRELETFVALNAPNPTVESIQVARNLQTLRNLKGNDRNDVNMTRVGVRFAF